MFEQPKTKIQICALFGCISDSLQPLAVHSHQLLCVQPNDSGKRNTAKSCTEYSQFICSVCICRPTLKKDPDHNVLTVIFQYSRQT